MAKQSTGISKKKNNWKEAQCTALSNQTWYLKQLKKARKDKHEILPFLHGNKKYDSRHYADRGMK